MKAAQNDFSEITKQQLIAFQAANRQLNVLQTEEPRYHAEMQIIFNLLKEHSDDFTRDNLDNTNYIGISKPCCLNCHAMLNVINLQIGLKSSFLVRAWHDKFGDSIVPNEVLSLLPTTIPVNIINAKYTATKRVAEQKVKENKDSSKGSTIKQARSSSPASQSEDNLVNLNHYNLTSLLEHTEKLFAIDLNIDGTSVKDEYIYAIRIWLSFHRIESYKELFNDFEDPNEVKTAIKSFLQEAIGSRDLQECINNKEKVIYGFFKSSYFNSPIKNMVCQILENVLPEFKTTRSRFVSK